MHFLVKWKGYPMSDNSWEPRENLHADRLIAEYNAKKQEQPEPKKKGVKSRRARMERETSNRIPSFTQQHILSPHSKILSAHSAPIVSSSTSSPVTHTSMLPSPPREAASPSLIAPIAPVVLMTTMKEEDVSEQSRMMPSTTPPVASQSGPRVPKAYVSDNPEHMDNCCNCRLPHDTRQALDPKYWPLVLVEQLAQEQDRKARWDREGANGLGVPEQDKEQDLLDWARKITSQIPKIEIQVTIVVKNSPEEGEKKPKKEASGMEERRCYDCHKIGHIKRQCPMRFKNKDKGIVHNKKPYYEKSTRKNMTRRTHIEVVSDPGDYDNKGEADFD